MNFGTRATKLRTFNVNDTPCPFCKFTDPQHVSIFGKYFYIMWIPTFPTSKVKVSECTNCKVTMEEKEFSPELAAKLDTPGLAKTPWWNWIGTGIIVAFFALVAMGG